MHPKHLWMLAEGKLLEHKKDIATQMNIIKKENKPI